MKDSIKTLFRFSLVLFMLVQAHPAFAEMVAIAGDATNLRSGPGTKYKIQWELAEGYPLRVLSRKGNWLKVRDFEGDQGWVHRKVTNRKSHMIVRVFYKKAKRINVRSGPGTGYKVVARAYYGVVFATHKKEKGWVEVSHPKGITGWVKQSLLWGF